MRQYDSVAGQDRLDPGFKRHGESIKHHGIDNTTKLNETNKAEKGVENN